MDELLTKYERELVILRSLCREYAQRYPKVAARLQMGGDTCDDPHVERLIQSTALLSARVSKRLDDSYPEFTEALLNLLYPHYLRPFPSCAIVRVSSALDRPDAIPAMPRGTLLESKPVHGVACRFRTIHDVKPSPVALRAASFETIIQAPVATRLPDDVTSSLTLTFGAAGWGPLPAADTATVLRIYADGDASFCATLRDALFVHTAAAYVQIDEDGPWERLPCIPIAPAGFAPDDALIPFDARSHGAYRILAEYFAFPEKFNFFDIDIAMLLARIPAGCASVTLRLGLAGIRPDADKARMLAGCRHSIWCRVARPSSICSSSLACRSRTTSARPITPFWRTPIFRRHMRCIRSMRYTWCARTATTRRSRHSSRSMRFSTAHNTPASKDATGSCVTTRRLPCAVRAMKKRLRSSAPIATRSKSREISCRLN